MKNVFSSLALSGCLFASAGAQDASSQPARRSADYFMQQLMTRQLQEQSNRVEGEVAQRREARFREQQFVERTNKFVKLWSCFAREYNDKGVFNVKVAKRVSKAFHELENSGEWPKSNLAAAPDSPR